MAGADPWNAPRAWNGRYRSPPPIYNFVGARCRRFIPRDAFWVEKYGNVEGVQGLAEKRVNIEVSNSADARKKSRLFTCRCRRLFPIIMAGAIFLAGLGMLVGWFRLVFLGLGLLGFTAISMSFEYKEWGEDNPRPGTRELPGSWTIAKSAYGRLSGSECVFFASLISTFMV